MSIYKPNLAQPGPDRLIHNPNCEYNNILYFNKTRGYTLIYIKYILCANPFDPFSFFYWTIWSKKKLHTERRISNLTRKPFLQFLSSFNFSTFMMPSKYSRKWMKHNRNFNSENSKTTKSYRFLCYFSSFILHESM